MLGSKQLIDRLGAHPATLLGLDLEEPSDRDTWLLAALVLSQRGREAAIQEALGALRARGLLDPQALKGAPDAVAEALEHGPWKDARPLTRRVLTLAQRLCEVGGVDTLRDGADGLEELGGRLAALAPGLGPAAILRFLRGLRDVWPDAADTPRTPAALAAARCLGLPEASAASGQADSRDLEAALERLGETACRAETPTRCPLAEACPRRVR